jgi:hypothetical protein
MRLVRSLALPFAVVALAVVPVRADEPPREVPAPPAAGPRVRLVTRVIDVVPDVAARWRDAAHPSWRALTEAEAARLLERQSENVVTSADVEAAFGQRSTLEVLNKTSYIADFDVEASMGDYIADPIVKQVVAGTVLDVETTRGWDERLLLAIEVRHTWIPPIRMECVRLAGSPQEVAIQFPELAGRTWQGEVSVPRGGHLLLQGAEGFPGANGTARLLLVTPTVLPEDAPGK